MPNVGRNKKDDSAKGLRWILIKRWWGWGWGAERLEDEKRWRGRAEECQLSAPG